MHGRGRTCAVSALCWALGGILVTVAVPHPSSTFTIVTLTQLAGALWLLNRLRTETHPRREAALISTIAILGRGMLLSLLAHLSMVKAGWTIPAQAVALGALLLLTAGQATVMLRHGPTTRKVRLPVTESHASPTRSEPAHSGPAGLGPA